MDRYTQYSKLFEKAEESIIYCFHAGMFQKMTASGSRKPSHATINNANNASFFISNSTLLDSFSRCSLAFHGSIWKTGLPKNDKYYPENPYSSIAKEKICRYYKLDSCINIFLFAPTHREDETLLPSLNLDYVKIKQCLTEKFGDEWVVFIRLHPANINNCIDLKTLFNNEVIDANHYPSMQDLVLATYAFLTDYSSTVFDIAERRIPCFTYLSDYEHFTMNVRELLVTPDELPFSYAFNEKDLIKTISTFDKVDYLSRWDSFSNKYGLCDSSNSSQLIASFISKYLQVGDKALNELPLQYEDSDLK